MQEVLVNCLFKLAQEKSVARSTDLPAMTIAVDLGRKATKQTNGSLMKVKSIAECSPALSDNWS